MREERTHQEKGPKKLVEGVVSDLSANYKKTLRSYDYSFQWMTVLTTSVDKIPFIESLILAQDERWRRA